MAAATPVMADPAPTNIPNLSSADMTQIATALGVDPRNYGVNQGQGQSYISQVPALIQAGSNIVGAVQNTAPVQWLLQNGYLTQGDNGFGPGWRSSGLTGQAVLPGQTTLAQLQTTGAYNPAQDIGTGWIDAQGMVPLVGASPFAGPTIGALDRSNISTPAQNPSAFGTSIWGPTENPANMVQNQDWISQYLIPLMEVGAGIGFGALGGFGDTGSVFQSLFKTGGAAIENTGSGQSTINPASLLPTILKMFGQGVQG